MTYEDLYELKDKWLETLDLKKTTKRTYGIMVRQWIDWLKRKKIVDPLWEDAQNYLDEIRRRKTTEIPQSTLRKFYDWMEDEGYYTDIFSPYKGTDEERIIKLLSMIQGTKEADYRDRAMIATITTANFTEPMIAAANVKHFMTLPNDEKALWIEKDKSFVILSPTTAGLIQTYLDNREYESEDEPLFRSVSNRAGTTDRRMSRFSISRILTARDRLIGSPRSIHAASMDIKNIEKLP